MRSSFDTIVIGGGFFGAMIAADRAKKGKEVLLVEREAELLQRASLNNQARVHGGYHYPRSLITGLRSRKNYAAFLAAFPECIDSSFEKYYAVSRKHSNVSAAQFVTFCERISAPLTAAPKHVVALFDPELIESVYRVEECMFDAVKLKGYVARELQDARVAVRCGAGATKVSDDKGPIRVHLQDGTAVVAPEVFLCTYANPNEILSNSGLPKIALRHELAELALVKPTPALAGIGVTVMCGPFFSLTPYPSRGLLSLSHVRYTPHCAWSSETQFSSELSRMPRPASRFALMRNDAARYLPEIAKVEYVESFFEVKTLLPRNDMNDARPILFQRNQGLEGLHCVTGAKIDNVFDIIAELPV